MSAFEFYDNKSNSGIPMIPVKIEVPAGETLLDKKIAFIGGIFKSATDNIVEALLPQTRVGCVSAWEGFKLIEPSQP